MILRRISYALIILFMFFLVYTAYPFCNEYGLTFSNLKEHLYKPVFLFDIQNTNVSLKPNGFWRMNEQQKHKFVIGANLSGKDLRYIIGRNAFFYNAYLSEVSFYHARLDNANMQWTNLTDAVLDSASLKGAMLNNANLSGAFLKGTNLCNANLTNANFSGVDLTETIGLTQEQLDVACGDTITTKLPPGLTIKQCPEEDECP